MFANESFKQQGFTLIELLIVLVIAGILISIAAPSFNSVVSERKLEEVRYSMASLLSYAKNEAVLRSEQVDLCGGVAAAPCDATAWSAGWRVVVNNGSELLRVDDSDTTGIVIAYDCGAPVTFDALGLRNSDANDCTFSFTNAAGVARNLVISETGRVLMP